MKNKNKILLISDGFYSAADKKLHYAELVCTNADIEIFYRKYGAENTR